MGPAGRAVPIDAGSKSWLFRILAGRAGVLYALRSWRVNRLWPDTVPNRALGSRQLSVTNCPSRTGILADPQCIRRTGGPH